MGVPLIIRSQNDLLYAYQLSAAYRSPWVFDPDWALHKEPDVWEIIRNEPVVLSELERRNRAVVRPWRVIPNRHATRSKDTPKGAVDASKRLASICYEALDHINEFDAARKRLADAFVVNRTYEFVEYEEKTISLDGLPPMKWFIPVRMQNIDRRRIHWVTDWDKGGFAKKKGVHLEMHDTDRYGWFRLSDDMRRNLVEYIYHNAEDRVGYGRGILPALYFAHYCKTSGVKKVSEGLDRYANGILKIKIDGLRAGSTGKTNDDLLEAAKKLAKNYRSEHYMVMEETDDVEIQDAPAGALKFSMEYIRYWDEVIARLFNGSTRPSGHGSQRSGARAEAVVQAESSEQWYQDDRIQLDQIVERDVLRSFIYHNWHNIEKAGLSEAKTPHFTCEQVKRQDPATEIEIMTKSVQAGAPIAVSEWYAAINKTPPDPEEEVISQEMLPEMQAMSMEKDALGQKNAAADKEGSRKENGMNADKTRRGWAGKDEKKVVGK